MFAMDDAHGQIFGPDSKFDAEPASHSPEILPDASELMAT